MRTIIIGDIHGSIESLKGVLGLASYNPIKDRLICLGDYIDGWENSYEVVELLLHYQNESPYENIYLLGNHDNYFKQILNENLRLFKEHDRVIVDYNSWFEQGGKATYESYRHRSDSEINRHKNLFFDRLAYYHLEDDYLFVHAGFNERLGLQATYRISRDELLWNRTLYQKAIMNKSNPDLHSAYKTIFIGHTPTISIGETTPQRVANVVNLDQGCKVDKRLSCWELGTDKWYQYVL